MKPPSLPSHSPAKQMHVANVSPVPSSPASSAQPMNKNRDVMNDSSEPLFTLVQFLSHTPEITTSRVAIPQSHAPSFWDGSGHSSNSNQRMREQSFEQQLYHSQEMYEQLSSNYSGPPDSGDITAEAQQQEVERKKEVYVIVTWCIKFFPSVMFSLIILTLWISLLMQGWGTAQPKTLPFDVAELPEQQIHHRGVYVKRKRDLVKGDTLRATSFTISIDKDVPRKVLINPMRFCVCLDPAVMACDDMADYIDSNRILSIVSLIVEVVLLIFVLNLPTSRRYMNGYFLILSVCLCYCLSLSLASTFQQISSNFCAQIPSVWGTSGISVQLRILETIMSGFLLLTSLFHCCRPRTNRFNVAGLKLLMVLFNLFSTIFSTFWTGWLVTDNTVFGLWAYCTCEPLKKRCNPAKLYVVCAFILLTLLHVHVVAILSRFFPAFFSKYRARLIWLLALLCASTLVVHSYGVATETCNLGVKFRLSAPFISLLFTMIFSIFWAVFVTLQNYKKINDAASLFVR